MNEIRKPTDARLRTRLVNAMLATLLLPLMSLMSVEQRTEMQLQVIQLEKDITALEVEIAAYRAKKHNEYAKDSASTK